MPRPTRLIAFKAPFVKGADCVAIPILTEVGEWAELVASPGTLRNLAAAIDQALPPPPAHATPAMRRRRLGGEGRPE